MLIAIFVVLFTIVFWAVEPVRHFGYHYNMMVDASTFVVAGLLWPLTGYALAVFFGKYDAEWQICLLVGVLFMMGVALGLLYMIL